MTNQELFRRKLQSAVDKARRQNIVRATETYAQTRKRIETQTKNGHSSLA